MLPDKNRRNQANEKTRIIVPKKLNLVTATNYELYNIAVDKTYEIFNDFFNMPTKRAHTQIRDCISYQFFRDQFLLLNEEFKNIENFKG
ncbi:hypothetical protein OAB57_01120 [Bacteriovoracaceae bacterium]|nr:hypothetical protein [Bacteriovoracaceae bacterium]